MGWLRHTVASKIAPPCARAFNMTQEERIADSDKTAVMNLEEELRKQMRRKSWYDIVAEYVKMHLEKMIGSFP